jgi:hypothetical protein
MEPGRGFQRPRRSRRDQTALGLTALGRLASRTDGTAPIVVAAAGNFGWSRPFYPAFDPWTISVGAAEHSAGIWGQACFSDHGDRRFGYWVDVSAQGVMSTAPTRSSPISRPPLRRQGRSRLTAGPTGTALPLPPPSQWASGQVAGRSQPQQACPRRRAARAVGADFPGRLVRALTEAWSTRP